MGGDIQNTPNIANAARIYGAPSHVWIFTDLSLMPGHRLSLQTANSKAQHSVLYIGSLPGRSLITTLPEGQEGWWHWKTGGTDKIVLRGLVNTHAFAIHGHPIFVSTTPYPLIHFLYPESVVVKQARSSPRVQVKLPADVTRVDTTVHEAMLQDVSVSGAMILSKVPLGEVGDILTARIPIILETHTQLISVFASIAWSSGDEKAGYLCGILFSEIPPETDLLLRAFVYFQLSMQPG